MVTFITRTHFMYQLLEIKLKINKCLNFTFDYLTCKNKIVGNRLNKHEAPFLL